MSGRHDGAATTSEGMSHREPVARRLYGLVEPVGPIPYLADEPNVALTALGLRNHWDTYFAGRAAEG